MLTQKTIVIISEHIDSTIREEQLDTKYHIFRTIDELSSYIETTPIRAESLYFTKDTIPYVNTNITYLLSLLSNPFLKVDNVYYITEINSSEIVMINHIITTMELDNWSIIEGPMTREFLNGSINGSLREDEFNPKRKAVYRVPKEAYLRDKLRNDSSLEEEYVDDDKYYSGIPYEEPISETTTETESFCEIIRVAGISSYERTAFALLSAQYLALKGRCIIIEKDVEFHTMTEFVTKYQVDCYVIEIADIISNPEEALNKIRKSQNSLVCVCAIDRIPYNYSFIVSLLYYNLINDFQYLVEENDVEEIVDGTNYILAIPADMVGVLKSCEHISTSNLDWIKFVAIHMGDLDNIKIKSSEALNIIISDILNVEKIKAYTVSVTTLLLRSDGSYDMNSIIGGGL